MKLVDTNIKESIEHARQMLKTQKVSAEFAAVLLLLFSILELLLPKLIKTTSKNSSLPPFQDPNRAKKPKSDGTNKKPGGQLGRIGKNLAPFATVDEVVDVPVDRATLPQGHEYAQHGVGKRQVLEICTARFIREYCLEILKDESGKIYKGIPPEGVT